MNKGSFSILALIAIVLSGEVQASKERGSADEAVCLIGNAMKYLREHGTERAVRAFKNHGGSFMNKDLYIIVSDGKKILTHHNRRFVGKELSILRTRDNRPFMSESAVGEDKGWIHYKILDPATRILEKKSAYFEELNGLLLLCAVHTPEKKNK